MQQVDLSLIKGIMQSVLDFSPTFLYDIGLPLETIHLENPCRVLCIGCCSLCLNVQDCGKCFGPIFKK